MAEFIAGIDLILEAEVDGTFVCIGGQSDTTMALNNTINAITYKKCAGVQDRHWVDNMYGLSDYSFDLTGLLAFSDDGQAALESAFMNQETLRARVRLPSGTHYQGTVLIETLEYTGDAEGTAEYSSTLVGTGALEITEGEPLSVRKSTLPKEATPKKAVK